MNTEVKHQCEMCFKPLQHEKTPDMFTCKYMEISQIEWQQTVSAEIVWWLRECHCYKRRPLLLRFHFPLHLFRHVIISVDSCLSLWLWGHIPEHAPISRAPLPPRPPPLLSWIHRHCPSPSLQQLLWAPGCCQKRFSSQSPTGASQWQRGMRWSRDGARPMSDTNKYTLPGGKVHSESRNVSIFNLSGRKKKEQSSHF